jgi:hypothetical protein
LYISLKIDNFCSVFSGFYFCKGKSSWAKVISVPEGVRFTGVQKVKPIRKRKINQKRKRRASNYIPGGPIFADTLLLPHNLL